TYLESSTSNAQDACNPDAPKSSGNSNPTATSKNPSADQMETLAVETVIPTVSSPIPTACLNDSPEPSIYHMDVKSAFLYGTIDEEVYVMQPLRFQDLEFPARVGTTDQTLFIRKHRGDFIIVQVYVDDIIFGSLNPQLSREFEALMHEKFQMSAMGELNFFLGLQVLQKKDGIFLSQDKYVGKDRTGKDVDLHLYRSMIGSLMYLTASRPDIMFAICACARHQVTPKECHLHAVKRIFRYLKGHPKLGLCYPKESPFDLVAYSDSDYSGATQDRKSTTGGCQLLGRRLISLAFCDYHNMVTILEKYKHNVDFHQIVDFVEASHIRYALTINPTVYVSYIRQFWSTARIKTTNEGTNILSPVDGKPRTISESSIRRNLKLNDEARISSLPDAELFENLTLMGMQHKLQKLMDLCTRLQRQQDEMASKITAQDLEISTLKARIKLLEDRDGCWDFTLRDDIDGITICYHSLIHKG
nr:hypothetical protein [Tanacetum cinerariifolium]